MYFQNTALTGVVHCLDFISEQFLSESWSVTHVGKDTAEPGTGYMNYSYVFQSPGKTGSVGDLPAHHYLSMTWGKDNQTNSMIYLGSWTGAKQIATGSISKTSDTVLISSSSPHNARVGDILFVHGTGDQDFHNGWESDDDPLVITTIIDENQFNYVDTDGPINISETNFENIFLLYNAKGTFSGNETANLFVIGNFDNMGSDNPSLDIYGYVDEYRMAGVIVGSGLYRWFYAGLTGRGHIPNDWSHVGKLTGSITGTGAPQELGMDRNCPNMKVGQPIWLVPPDDADGTKDDDMGQPALIGPGATAVTCSAKPNEYTCEVTLNSGDEYPAGTLVGFDPVPLILIGFEGAGSNTNFYTYNCCWTFYPGDGYNETSIYEHDIAFPCERGPRDANSEAATDPDRGNFYHGWDLQIQGNGTEGLRYPLVGFVAWAVGAQNTGDLMVVGENIAANRWKVFDSTAGYADTLPAQLLMSIGPGAS